MEMEQLLGGPPPMGLILALRFLALVRESGASQKDAFIALGVAERLVTALPEVPMVPTDEV